MSRATAHYYPLLAALLLLFSTPSAAADGEPASPPLPEPAPLVAAPEPPSTPLGATNCLLSAANSALDIRSVTSFYWDYQPGLPPRQVTPPLLRFVMYLNPLKVSLDAGGIRIEERGGSYIRVGQRRFDLVDIRARSPSGHRISGQDYPAELILLHRDGGELAVVSVFVQEGVNRHPVLAEILDAVPHDTGETASFRHRYIDTALLIPGSKGYYRYTEDAASPECGDKIQHYVLKRPIYATHEQILALRGLPGNPVVETAEQGQRQVLQTPY